jgi:hypothetical protein
MRAASIVVSTLLVVGVASAAGLPELPGWTPAGEVQTFDAGTLYEYINGAADAFLAYGFQLLTVGEVRAGDTTVAISIYDMGTPLNAFGIYRSEAPGDAERLAIGGEAVLMPPYQSLLLKGRHYVKVDTYDGELDAAASRSLVAALAAALSGDDGLPDAVQALPAGLVKGTEGYTRSSYLGLGELDRCVHATYRNQAGAERQVFQIVPEGSVDAAWQALASRWTAVAHEAFPVLARKVPYRGLVGVRRVGDRIVGVADAADTAELLDRLAQLE